MLVSLDDYARAARRRLPRTIYDVIAGGAGDEITLAANRAAFARIGLRPRALADVSSRRLATTVLGQPISMPVMLDPTGYARMAHRDAELAVARAAADAATLYAVSTITSYSLEAIAEASAGPNWFQLYPPADRGACRALIARAEAAGYAALCVTIDGATQGLRERDLKNRLTVPFRITPRRVLEGAVKPRWTASFLLGGVGRGGQGFGTHSPRPLSVRDAGAAIAATARAVTAATARAVTADEIAFIRDVWPRPLVVKGVQRADECDLLCELGVDGLVVSNHGGRQLDGVPASIDILPEVVEAMAGRGEVYLDSGVRRGTDVIKALALGARAVLIGRPYLYGLAVAGQAGVRHVLEILRAEIDQTMVLLGCNDVGALDHSWVSAGRPARVEGR
jgi:isopentenyl diphosphate isomerase/L-lactate dehydrogenase-like FMN-dependent dehydrogenase